MRRWLERGLQVNDENDLDDYMFEVAGGVGYLVMQLYAWYSIEIRRKQDQLMPLAREFGLGLQTVNVIRGLREDYERGWMYVPRKFLPPPAPPPPNLSRRKISREEVRQIVLDATVWGWSNLWLDQYYRKLSTAGGK